MRKEAAGKPQLLTITRAGIVAQFVPTRIEKIITETMSRDEELVADLVKRNITPVVVPDDDPDHQGSVHDKDEK